MSGISDEKRMTRDGHRVLIAAILKEEGPKTSEELKSSCGRRGIVVSTSSVRKICCEAAEQKAISRRLVKTTRYRMGVVLWSCNDETEDKLSEAKQRLEGPTPRMVFGGQGASELPVRPPAFTKQVSKSGERLR